MEPNTRIFCYVVLFGVAVCIGQSEGTSEQVTKSVTVVGLYTDGSAGWRQLLSDTWEEVITQAQSPSPLHLTMKPVILTYSYLLTYRDIQAALKTINKLHISVIIGPQNDALRLAAADADVPYVILSQLMTSGSMSYNTVIPTSRRREFYMWPSSRTLHQSVCDVVLTYGWTQTAVLYQDEMGLQFIGELMTHNLEKVRSWRLPVDIPQTTIRNYLLVIREQQLRQIVIATSKPVVDVILEEALRLSMMSGHYSWVLSEPLSYEMDLSQYNYTQVNFSVFHFGPEPTVIIPFEEGTSIQTETDAPKYSLYPIVQPADLRTRLAKDVMTLVMRASFAYSSQNAPVICQETSCEDYVTGSSLDGFLRMERFIGETGPVIFDYNSNTRTNVSLILLTLTETGLRRAGEWTSSGLSPAERLMIDDNGESDNVPSPYVGPYPLGRTPLNIVFMIDAPFIRRKRNYYSYEGNDQYEGFLVDLIERIALKLNFQYILYESPDGNYGSHQSGEWNGMIRELITGNASMCLGAISITSERETAVDFTKPFMQKTFNILIKKPLERTSPFQFLWPFSTYIWLYTLTVLLLVSILLFAMDKFSPNFAQTAFTLSESVWFMYGSLVGAGAEMFPRTISGRLLSAAWWFFSLILVSSYTANLAAFLTVTRIVTPIKSIPDLASQTKIRYGTVKDTYAHSLFRNSKMEVIKKMWNFMDQLNPDSMVDNTSVGIEKVKNGDYAFIWDSPINRYTAMHECDTMVVGDSFDEKGLGIGVPLGAPYRDDLTMTILSLQEDGTSQALYDKWWDSGQCEGFQETTTSRTKELDMPNIAGVFLVLAGGVLVSVFVCGAEVLHSKLKARVLRKQKNLQESDQECVMSALPTSNNFTTNSKDEETKVR